MCVIIGLKAGTAIPFNALKNASLNNPDGYGLVIRGDAKHMEVIKKVDKAGNDPDAVAALLEQFKGNDRYLHLRYATAGTVVEGNAHPFTVFKHGDHQIEFMHNGSINDYRPGTGDDSSDTLLFAKNFLSPYLYSLKEVDIDDTMTITVIEKFLGAMSKGLLISNVQGPSFLNSWKKIKGEDDAELMVSNDDYFGDVKAYRRGKYEPQKTTHYTHGHGHGGMGGQSVIPLAAPSSTGASANSNVSGVNAKSSVDIATTKINNKPSGRSISSKEFADIMDLGGDELNDDAITYFSYCLPHELENFFEQSSEVAVRLFDAIVTRFTEIVVERDELEEERDKYEEKHMKATNLIASLQFEINELKKGLPHADAA